MTQNDPVSYDRYHRGDNHHHSVSEKYISLSFQLTLDILGQYTPGIVVNINKESSSADWTMSSCTVKTNYTKLLVPFWWHSRRAFASRNISNKLDITRRTFNNFAKI
ncbi:hypothetical protein KUTeg_008781 [Tegillarca granosa]|uniref:Uncharacterized protein n=1 Tax=Tegillarca granosa TaxID=220873 RepID=A0ABQ9FEX8_TEGGR|nr:hypothetical protein KUTeg_008781 [Tegillarca granosa]